MKAVPIVLLVLNGVVLLGQLWPEGAPPFARAVNIAFLAGNLVWLVRSLRTSPARPG